MKTRNGFTVIEVVVVMVILSLMAAFTLPRFVNMRSESKVAALKGLAAAIRSASSLVQMKWTVSGLGSTVPLADGTAIDVVPATGLPRASVTGIDAAAGIYTGQFTCTGSPVRTCTPVSGPAGCFITYNEVTGAVDESNAIIAGGGAPKGKGKGKGVTPGC